MHSGAFAAPNKAVRAEFGGQREELFGAERFSLLLFGRHACAPTGAGVFRCQRTSVDAQFGRFFWIWFWEITFSVFLKMCDSLAVFY